MPKKPSPEDFLTAAEWLDVNEGDDGEKESCHRVAEWLRDAVAKSDKRKADDSVIRQLAQKTGASTKDARAFWKRRQQQEQNPDA